MSQASMSQLNDWLQTLPGRIQRAANQRKIDAVLAIENQLTQTTPIDTGAAISNWIVSQDAPSTLTVEPYAPSELGTHTHPIHGEVAGAGYNAAGAMDAARVAVAGVAPGTPLFITNNLPYIGYLNVDGISEQAAPGFVERAVTLGKDVTDRAKLDP